MDSIRDLINAIQFAPKERAKNIFTKTYKNGAMIEIDITKEKIIYDPRIRKESETTSNFLRPENFIVLECVNRLLEKGYKPENIILEKTWKLGHNGKGRLDIIVTQTDSKTKKEVSYLMIECKTAGKEFKKELANMQKDGGQLFSYFQQDKSAALLVLYASELKNNKIDYQNEIIPISENIRNAASIKEMFQIWDKNTKQNGIFENTPYNFCPTVLTIDLLIPLGQEQSGKIFNGFLEILRHNVVSDKPNAFNKIFSLFLCKIFDELKHDTERPQDRNTPLDFQYIPGETDEVFQLRLNDLYKKGMEYLLGKKITDMSLADFDTKYKNLNEETKEDLRKEIIKLRLQKNNEFAIKDVFDEDSFRQNAVVLREVVELLQPFKLRYTHKNQFLSDFFELLLTTGLKQETGQFFTPVPIAQFILKSIPIDHMITEKLQNGEHGNYLPHIIDYASGSGHFLTESMDIIQNFIENETDSIPLQKSVRNFVNTAKSDNYHWAKEYIYGIEKDYRLVKVGKVGCYLHGDGLANVIHSDGLAHFSHKEYTGKLIQTNKDFPQENKQFDIVVSNPPYSVSGFKNVTSDYYTEKDFELYGHITDQSSEIETLFIERTKQLLHDNGMAGIILPSSILSNAGIYTKAREIILQYFEIIAITELGSNTFMATGTNTVVLFLRRRNNYEVRNLTQSIEKVFENLQDVTLNGIENTLSKYISHVWGNLTVDDYTSILKKEPTQTAKNSDLFKEYRKKLRITPKKSIPEIEVKAQSEFWEKLLKIEREKFLYFLLTYNKKVVLIHSGQKDEEKRFLGYEFSNRRGSEGIHPIQKGKKADGTLITISDCTKLFDENAWENPEKASTYVYKAFLGEYPEIHKNLQKHIYHANLHNMLTFDRVEFDKLISTSIKKKVVFEDIWNSNNLVSLGDIANIEKGKYITKQQINKGNIPVIAGGKTPAYFHNVANRYGNVITVSASGAAGFVNYFTMPIFASDCNTIISKDEKVISTKLIYEFLKSIQDYIYTLQKGIGVPHVYAKDLAEIKLPLPPISVQDQIVTEIEKLEEQEQKAKNEVEKLKGEIGGLFEQIEKHANKNIRLSNDIFDISIGKRVLKREFKVDGKIPVYSANVFEPFGMIDKLIIEDFSVPSVLWGIDGDWQVNYIPANTQFYPTDHCGVLRVKNNYLNEKYLAYILNKEGVEQKFSRNYRASIDRVSNIRIPIPPLSIQEQIVAEIEKLEIQIEKLESELKKTPRKKETVLQGIVK